MQQRHVNQLVQLVNTGALDELRQAVIDDIHTEWDKAVTVEMREKYHCEFQAMQRIERKIRAIADDDRIRQTADSITKQSAANIDR